MPAIRVREDLHEKIAVVAASEGRSAANYLDWVMRPIVDRALGEELESAAREVSHAGRGEGRRGAAARSGASPTRTSAKRNGRAPAKPKTRGRASSEWIGCTEHPDAGAVAVGAGRMACGEPGCANGARMASA